jgi:hypothetical protein
MIVILKSEFLTLMWGEWRGRERVMGKKSNNYSKFKFMKWYKKLNEFCIIISIYIIKMNLIYYLIIKENNNDIIL